MMLRIPRSKPPEAPEGIAEWGPAPPRGHRRLLAVVVLLLLVVAAFVVVSPNVDVTAQKVRDAVSGLLSLFPGLGSTQSLLNYTVYSPVIQNGSAKITYPPDFSTLADYALGLINTDRAGSGLNAVTLSSIQVAQQHADSMLRFSYFSHWDTQGFKPYMRYTLLDGKGAVEENVAVAYLPGRYTTTSAVEDAIGTLEHEMMYNDSACCNNGHRLNILNPLHNRVSIGVAYDGNSVYFAEDFENYYVNLTFSVSSAYGVTISGTPAQSSPISKLAYITFDGTPSAETPAQLNSGPREYTPGTLIGGILPPCGILSCQSFSPGITVHATTWRFTTSAVDITFSLHDFIQAYGAGVYTVYLITGSDTSTAITSISVFVSGP